MRGVTEQVEAREAAGTPQHKECPAPDADATGAETLCPRFSLPFAPSQTGLSPLS